MAVEKDIESVQSFSGIEITDTDRSIHKIRKSLKSVSAILLLYKGRLDPVQYLSWKLFLKTLSKKYAFLREPYVYLQTFNQIEHKLIGLNNFNPDEIRNYLEIQYKLIVNETIVNETIQQGDKAILKLTETHNDFHVSYKPKRLKRMLLKSFKKSERLFKKLRLTSSHEAYHGFRKWCKIFYYQLAVLHRIELVNSSKNNKRLYKLTDYLGKEHDLQLFFQYLVVHFPEFSVSSESFFRLRIKKLRKKILVLYPRLINYGINVCR